jgi:hypothetical protein
MAARPTIPQATPMPAFAPVDSPDACLDCADAFDVSGPAVFPEMAVSVEVDVLVEVGVLVEEAALVEVPDELELVLVGAKFQPFI